VQVVVDQTGQHTPRFQVDDSCRRVGQRHHLFVAPDRDKDSVADRDSAGVRVRSIQRGKAPVSQNQIGAYVRTSRSMASPLADFVGSSPKMCGTQSALIQPIFSRYRA
jgi:hypothetical protein